MKFIDLQFMGRRHVIATAILEGPSGIAVIDPGPTTCLHALTSGLEAHGYELNDVRDILLTHIHLDHAGVTGTLTTRLPGVRVHVHERGAPHMVDPSKLLVSATRLYGEDMDRLWGEMLPVPAARVNVLAGGEALDLAGRTLQVAYTPGHASHHVSFLDLSTGDAYVGDTCGIRVAGTFTIAPTPPPDIDLEAWDRSLAVIEGWKPAALFLTHFGSYSDAADHLRRFRTTLDRAARRVKATLDEEGTDEQRIEHFITQMREDARAAMSAGDAVSTETAAPFEQLWLGLARYWRKRAGEARS